MKRMLREQFGNGTSAGGDEEPPSNDDSGVDLLQPRSDLIMAHILMPAKKRGGSTWLKKRLKQRGWR